MPRANNDSQHLTRLQRYRREHRALPTTGMAELLGLSSTGTVFEMVALPKVAGYLSQGPERRLVSGRRFFLRAPHPDVADIRPRERMALYGLVVGVFRSYGGLAETSVL